VVDFFASVERVTTLQAVLNSGTSVRIFSLLGKLFKLRWRCRCLSESGTRPRNRGSSLAAVSSCPIARARRSAALNWSAVPASIMRPNTSAPGGLGQESRPSAQRYSISIVRPSIQPNSRSRCHKTATRWACVAGVLTPKADRRQPGSLLRMRCEWPRHYRRAAKCRDEQGESRALRTNRRFKNAACEDTPVR